MITSRTRRGGIPPTSVALACLLAALVAPRPAPAGGAQAPRQCRVEASLVSLPGIPEASGLAISRRVPGRLWTHNDSGQPELFTLDHGGRVTARVPVAGAEVEDWEAVATGPCPAGDCLFIADIGDNDAVRPFVTVYRLEEPADSPPSSLAADVVRATYPDGPRDAETLLVTPDGRLFIVTKSRNASGAIYRFPAGFQAGASVRLERVGKPRGDGEGPVDEPVTDGAVSPDGAWVVLRSERTLVFHRLADLTAGRWHEASRIDLRPLGEPQGEGVAVAADGAIYLAGESGAPGAGTFARLRCPPTSG
jgi:hypothetical protein